MYNNYGNLDNINSFFRLFLFADAEHDTLNNLVCRRSALKTLLAPAFLLLMLGISLYFIIINDLNLIYLVYIVIPFGLILFLSFFFNVAKSTYVIKVSENQISKKYLFRRKISINYTDIESAEIVMPKAGNQELYNAPDLSFVKMSIAIKSLKEIIVIPVFIKGFIEFYKVFKKNFQNVQSQNVLKDITLNFMRAGIDLETETIRTPNQNHGGFASSPFEGF